MKTPIACAAALYLLAADASAQTVGPDGFGYVADPISLDFTDVSGTGTDVGLSGLDDAGVVVPIGFTFELYGVPLTSIGVSTNGYLASDPDLSDFSNDCPIADPLDPNLGIYPFWDDLSLTAHGTVYHEVQGTAPDRVAIFQFDDVHTFASAGASLTFQVKLFETSNQIEFHYLSIAAATSGSATIGVEDAGGADGLAISCDEVGVGTGDAWRIRRLFPFISAPKTVDQGTSLTLSGVGEPGALYLTALGTTPGPTCFGGPFCIDLGPTLTSILVVDSGVVAGDGSFGFTATVPTSPSLACLDVFFQSFTVLSTIEKTNFIRVVLEDPAAVQMATGSLDTAGVGDHYTFTGSVADVVTIELCRTDNTGTGQGTLDPFLCVFAPSGELVASDDDSGGECEVPGPFGSSLVTDLLLLESGSYTVVASAFQGLGDETGTYRLIVDGCTGSDLTLVQDEGPPCPAPASASPKLDPDLVK